MKHRLQRVTRTEVVRCTLENVHMTLAGKHSFLSFTRQRSFSVDLRSTYQDLHRGLMLAGFRVSGDLCGIAVRAE